MIISNIARNEIWVLVWMYLVSTTAERPRCPKGATTDQCREDGVFEKYFYNVNGIELQVTYDSTLYHLTCPDNVSLEYEALPRFATAVNVSKARFTACAPPLHGYAAALRTLGVSPRSLELEELTERPALAAVHLRGLALDDLTLSAVTPLPLNPTFVESLANLSTLHLTNVSLMHAAAMLLPPTLRSLSLVGVGVAELPAKVFRRLPALTHLILRDIMVSELDLSEAAALRFVSLMGPYAGVTLGPSVVNVTLRRVLGAALLGNCSSLERVFVEDFEEPLPARWLVACPVLQEVRVHCGRTGLLRADLLDGARALRDLTVRHCGLRQLPSQWLTEATELVALDLSDNDLQWLPSELANAAALEHLELAGNRLSASALEALAAMPMLRHLSLERNPLGDLCGSGHLFVANALSPLWRACCLRVLSLASTGLTRICRDWRTELEWLTDLDLRHNGVSLLEFDDLQWRRRNATLVDLRGNPVRDVHYSREQFAAVLAGNMSSDFASSRMTTLVLDGDSLQCDCASYWFVRAIREQPQHARAALRGAQCGSHVALEEIDPRELQCTLPSHVGCPAGCVCRGTDEHSELFCEYAGLTRVPRAPPGLPARMLLLPHNNISRLTLEDFTSDLEVLDLSNNLIADVDAATTAALLDSPRIVCLAGNPLRCDAMPLLRALVAHVAPQAGGAGDARYSCLGGGDALATARELAHRCGLAV